jgi:[acyl-carrier-protein] S-malonyltransferase
MAAVLGLEPEEVERLCAREARGRVLEVAGLNCPGQVSVAGHREAVEALIEAALAEGARNAALLKVSAPFHSSLMAAAADRLAEALASCVIDVPLCPIVPNVDAEPTRDPERIRENLVAQMTKPVRWEACLRRMMALGALSFLELGPGRSVAGMIRRVDRRAHVLSLDRSDVWR